MRDGRRDWAAIFLRNIKPPLGRILAAPQRWRKIRGNNRKLNFQRFPYAVVYSIRSDTLCVKAVMHLHRRPSYWLKRQFPI